MSENLSRRSFLTLSSGLIVMSVAGCSSQSPSSDRPQYVMVFDQTKCVGCRECMRACNEVNHLPPGVSRLIMERAPTKDRHYIRVSCQQCQNSPCTKVCPTAACHHDEKTGIVTMDASKCVGCKYCIAACPYNARFINEHTKAADNCNFCLDTRLGKGLLPGCVAHCRYHALAFGDLRDPGSLVSRILSYHDTVQIRTWLGTHPTLRYIPVAQESQGGS